MNENGISSISERQRVSAAYRLTATRYREIQLLQAMQ